MPCFNKNSSTERARSSLSLRLQSSAPRSSACPSPAMCVYSPWLVFWSVAVAVVIAFAALNRAFAFRETATSWSLRQVVNALILGAAIPTMHYLGMAAASFVPSSLDPGTLRYAISISDLSFAGITLVSIMVLCLVFLTSLAVTEGAELPQALRM